MRPLSIALVTVGIIGTLASATASAQQTNNNPQPHIGTAHRSAYFDLHPELTKEEFTEFTKELGSVLRFRQGGDAATVARGRREISVQLGNVPIDGAKSAWINTTSRPTASYSLGRTLSFPRVVGRFGVNDRVDVGVWGGVNPYANYGLLGADTKIVLVNQSVNRPVTVSVRPSLTALVGASEVWAANMSVDLTVSRAMGRLSPFAGVGASTSGAIERSSDVRLDPVSAGDTLSYAGLAYRWRSLVASAEVERGTFVTYAFRVGTRF